MTSEDIDLNVLYVEVGLGVCFHRHQFRATINERNKTAYFHVLFDIRINSGKKSTSVLGCLIKFR